MARSSTAAKEASVTGSRPGTDSPAAVASRSSKQRRTEQASESEAENELRVTTDVREGDEAGEKNGSEADEDEKFDNAPSSVVEEDVEDDDDVDDSASDASSLAPLGPQAETLLQKFRLDLQEVRKDLRKEMSDMYAASQQDLRMHMGRLRRFIIEELDLRAVALPSGDSVSDAKSSARRKARPAKSLPPIRISARAPANQAPPVRANGIASTSRSASTSNLIGAGSTSKRNVPGSSRAASEQESPSKRVRASSGRAKPAGMRVPTAETMEEVIENMEFGNPNGGIPPLLHWKREAVTGYSDAKANTLEFYRHEMLYRAYKEMCGCNLAKFYRLFDSLGRRDLDEIEEEVKVMLGQQKHEREGADEVESDA